VTTKSDEIELVKALGVTCELLGAQLSEATVRVMAGDLAAYPLSQVLGALTRCRRELAAGRFSLAAVIDRLDDGRPGPEEAWAMIPRDERTSVVWTDEMAEAFGVCYQMIEVGEYIPARMAFIETYKARVAVARANRIAVRWTPSLGQDSTGRETVLRDAVEKGRLTRAHVAKLLPSPPADLQALLK